MARARRLLRLILLCLIQGLMLYYLTHYRIVIVQLLVLGASMVSVLVILTVFPYDKAPPQAKEAYVWWRQAARIVVITIVLISTIWAWMPHRK